MNKKQYIFPLTEVTKVNFSAVILAESPVVPVPPHPAPALPDGGSLI